MNAVSRVVGVRLPRDTYREVQVALIRFEIPSLTAFMARAVEAYLAALRAEHNNGEGLL